MKILDWYILKRYLFTFLMMLLLFIPIGITINLAEKIGKILENNVPFGEVAMYYLNFTIYFARANREVWKTYIQRRVKP